MSEVRSCRMQRRSSLEVFDGNVDMDGELEKEFVLIDQQMCELAYDIWPDP